MKIWLDTVNVEYVKKASSLGLLYGVTTNPSLIAEHGKSMKAVLQQLLDSQDGPVTAQVCATSTEEMVAQGEDLYDFSDRIIVKVPVTKEGYEAIHILSEKSIQTMATVVFYPYQAFVASQAGANYIAPYLSQIEKLGNDVETTLYTMTAVLFNSEAKILAASLKSVEQFEKCAEIGLPHVTVKDTLFEEIITTASATEDRLELFAKDWAKSGLTF